MNNDKHKKNKNTSFPWQMKGTVRNGLLYF